MARPKAACYVPHLKGHDKSDKLPSTYYTAYLQSPRVFIRLVEGHLNVLDVQSFLERKRDRALLSVRDETLAARPPRLGVHEVTVSA